jgi:hypothetical protein
MLGVERAHARERRLRLGGPLRVEGGDGPLAGDLELGLRRLLADRLLADLGGVLVSGEHLEHLVGGGDRRVEVPRVVALRGADEQPVRLDRRDPLLAGRRRGDDRFEGGHVDVRRRVPGLLEQLPGRGEPRIHLEDEVAPDQAVVALPLLEEVERVPERRQDLVPDFTGERGVAGVPLGRRRAHARGRRADGGRGVFVLTVRQL